MELFLDSLPLSDVEELVQRAQRGDPVALERLVAALAPYVGRICAAIALDDGPDATQETMILVIKNLRRLREPAALRSWARRIAVREALRLTTARRPVPVDPADLAPVAVPDSGEAVQIAETLRSLPPQQRAVLMLRHVEGLTEAEIAELLDIPLGTLKSRASRAREAFRRRWLT
jgi:RNA polymerase sigma factor (sigma-70 family)